MPKAVGVSRDCYAIEQHWQLDDYPISCDEGERIVEWYGKRLGMPEVLVVDGQATVRNYGKYYPAENGTAARIKLQNSGHNLGTLLHELAHHHQRARGLHSWLHDGVFHDSHRTVLSLVCELFKAKYGGEVRFGL